MKRFYFTLAALAMLTAANAQLRTEQDSVRMIELQQVEVTATRATSGTPIAYADIPQAVIDRNSSGYDIPSLLALTPSMIATNETGIGIGGTSMRLRGTDATRLNVTINGVSLNNPDSHAMYWYDTPDLISAVGSMQVQRGAGISTNGTGAFGGAISMTTDALAVDFGGDASLSYGSYNTNKQALHLSSGLMGGHWLVDARLSHIGSDGYVDRGTTDLKSFMLQAGYYGGRSMLKFVSFGGKSRTYLTYNGVTAEDMELYGRRYHTGGQYATSDGPFVLADGTHVGYYDDQTDNYLQINNQLLFSQELSARWSLNATAFYTYGYGFYKQYKDNAKLPEYLNISDEWAYDATGGKVRRDLIREKLMRNHLGGLHASANYRSERLDVTLGGSWSAYTCPHWGELDWVDGLDADKIGGRWYDNDVQKRDANLFARASWKVTKGLSVFGDLQYRRVHYKASGVNDNFVSKSVGMQPINVDKRYNFVNPHIGVNYTFAKRHTLYASFAVAQKEPTRSDFTDRYMFADADTYPTAERLTDYELGYLYVSPRLSLGVNLYYMDYTDQLVPTGRINDGYDALNDNVPQSYRRGVELTARWDATAWLSLAANATFSQNRIRNYTHRVVDYGMAGNVAGAYGYHEMAMGTTRLAYSPKSIASVEIDLHRGGFEAIWHTQYVSKQYFTNYENPNMQLDAYCVTNLHLDYTLRTGEKRSVVFGVQINNLFSARFSSNGYGWSEAYTANGVTEQSDHAYYFPQAPCHVLANVMVKF